MVEMYSFKKDEVDDKENQTYLSNPRLFPGHLFFKGRKE